MPNIDWDSLPDAPAADAGGINWDALPDAPAVPAQKQGERFNFAENPISATLGAAMSVPDLVKAGVDAATTDETLSGALGRYYSGDKNYVPGEQAVEKLIPNEQNVGLRTAAKTALDVSADPTTWAAPFLKGTPQIAKVVQQAETATPGMGMKAIGKLGEFFTGGRMSPKWPGATAKFTPKERIFSGSTLDEAADAYHPLKKAADDFMSGRLTEKAKSLFKPVTRMTEAAVGGAEPGLVRAGAKSGAAFHNPNFAKLDEAAQSFDDALAKLSRMRNGADAPAELQAIQKGLHQIKSRGVTAGPETAELMDFVNNIEFTGFGNPKLVKDILKAPQREVRAALRALTEESSPVYAAARQRIADAITMAAPPTGGKMGKYMIQNAPTMAAGAGMADAAIGGRWGDAARVGGAILGLRNPKAYNVAAGLGGYAAEIPGALKGAAGALNATPVNQLARQAIANAPRAASGAVAGAVEINRTLNENPQAFGKFAPVLQKAQQRGPAAVTAVNHVLMTDGGAKGQEYRALQRKLSGQESPEGEMQ